MSLNVLVAGVPYGYQGHVDDGVWLTPQNRATILAAAPGITLEHPRISQLNVGVPPQRAPHAILVETSGTLLDWETLPWILKAPGLELLVGPELRFVQSCSAGVEQLVDLVPDGVPLANASGVHAPAIAESVFANILADAKMLEHRRSDQAERAWRALPCWELATSVMCVIGTGAIGIEVAKRAAAFGMRTIGISRSGRPVAVFDEVGPTADLHRALAVADYVVIAAPLTAETAGLIDAAALAAMKPGSYLVNVARGAIIDEDALIASITRGHPRGAYLDCLVKEPPPQDSPLWTLPGVSISPHDAHASQFLGDRHVEIFAANLRRLATDAPLQNLVELSRGY